VSRFSLSRRCAAILHRRIRRPVRTIRADALDHLEEHAQTLHGCVEVIELAAFLSIVENPELAHGVDETGVKREASVKVLVVVVRHGEQWRPAVPHDARGGENVSGREGDVLGFRHRGGPFSAT
jgi:hypothetical protein